jgi:SAM-dependent methyltransferase
MNFRAFLAVAIALFSHAAPAQYDSVQAAPFVTTPADVVDRMLALARTGPADYVVDLGSGDGRIVIAAARKFGARGLGLELDPKLVAQSKDNARAAGVEGRAEFRVEDVLRADFSQATVVTVYLLPGLMAQLSPVFLDGLHPGARIVTHAFVFPSWKPDRVEKIRVAEPHPSQGDESTIFLWIVPAKARGAWHAASPEGEWRVQVDQNFQEIDVAGACGAAKLDIRQAKLEGRKVGFSGTLGTAPFAFAGRVEDDRMAGQAQLGGRTLPLEFTK